MRTSKLFASLFLVACSGKAPTAASNAHDVSPAVDAGSVNAADGGAHVASAAARSADSVDPSAKSEGAAAGAAATDRSGRAETTLPQAGSSATPPSAKPGPASANSEAGSHANSPMAGSGSMMIEAAGAAGGAPAALSGTGSCCAEHETAGCGNADLQVCVCEKLPSCCTDKWTAACTYIVTQKYCQPGVRECVCGSGTDQWGQARCCEQQWSASCGEIATSKCNAAPGCL